MLRRPLSQQHFSRSELRVLLLTPKHLQQVLSWTFKDIEHVLLHSNGPMELGRIGDGIDDVHHANEAYVQCHMWSIAIIMLPTVSYF